MRDDSAMAVESRPGCSNEPPGSELKRELNELFNAQYPGRAAKPGWVTTPDEMVPPDRVFLVGWDGERALAIGGLRRLDDGTAEIKRERDVAWVPGRAGSAAPCSWRSRTAPASSAMSVCASTRDPHRSTASTCSAGPGTSRSRSTTRTTSRCTSARRPWKPSAAQHRLEVHTELRERLVGDRVERVLLDGAARRRRPRRSYEPPRILRPPASRGGRSWPSRRRGRRRRRSRATIRSTWLWVASSRSESVTLAFVLSVTRPTSASKSTS